MRTDEAPMRELVEAPHTEWGVPPFEPLSIRTQDYERVPVLDGPMMVSAIPALLAPAAAAAAPPCRQSARRRRSARSGRVPTLLPDHRSQRGGAGADAQCQRAAENRDGARLRGR